MNRTSTPAKFILILLVSCLATAAEGQLPTGSLEVSARLRIDGKQQKLIHKRFYLLRGGLDENKGLLERIRTAQITSRDCYYSRAQASPQFICWLQTENCDSPYCRQIEMTDIDRVPEFKTAYQKGLALFGQKTDIASMWITTNLSPVLTTAYVRDQRLLVEKLLGGITPVQSSMTDPNTFKTVYVDIPLKAADPDASEMFTVSNVRPIELSGKSFVWSCEVEISSENLATLRLQVPENNKPVKNCEVVVKDLTLCKSGVCDQK